MLASFFLSCVLGALSACTGATSGFTSVPQAQRDEARRAPRSASSGLITHIFIVIQENRSFENLFRGFPGANAPLYGYLGSTKTTLQPVALNNPAELHNRWIYALKDWDNGKMDGFSISAMQGQQPTYPYSYVPQSQIQPYWTLASRYVLADRMFATEFGASFTAHLDLIDGNTVLPPGTYAEADYPPNYVWGCNAAAGTKTYLVNHARQESYNGPFPCFTQVRTMADSLDAAHISWRYYAPSVSEGFGSTMWSAFSAIKNVYTGPDWSNVVTPESRVLTDVTKSSFPNVVWITPDWANSDHPGNGSATGPSWVASVVNAVGASRFWQSSAIIVLWDDWGGWYDNVPPPQRDFLGLGMRVPCIIISPYSRIAPGRTAGYVSDTTYEFGSVLKFIEQTFNLAPLGTTANGYTDSRATSIIDSFDFTQKPRAFKAISAKYPASYFLHQTPSMRAPDEY
ncbi:MAG TPA: alkaline phosphatase family protein [Candidatus Baltobacteraceae bacterium]|nr:alkaline phosphatase family protein [Candidatus Baltobacteraceae bacterium]